MLSKLQVLFHFLHLFFKFWLTFSRFLQFFCSTYFYTKPLKNHKNCEYFFYLKIKKILNSKVKFLVRNFCAKLKWEISAHYFDGKVTCDCGGATWGCGGSDARAGARPRDPGKDAGTAPPMTAPGGLDPAPYVHLETRPISKCVCPERAPSELSLDIAPSEPLVDFYENMKYLMTKFRR